MPLAPHEFTHLKVTFDQAARAHPNLMESYVIMFEDADGTDERTRVMWAGLRNTIKQRYPLGEVT